MVNPDEAREEAWQVVTRESSWRGVRLKSHQEDAFAMWDARGRYDEQRIAALEAALRRYMLYVDSYGYESTGPLAQAFGPVEHPGSSISTEAWLDRVLREPALRALGQSEEVKP